ncbi:hypothetical protein [Streptomyces sp. CA-179760]
MLATVEIDGHVGEALEPVVARMSLAPGVRKLRWYLEAEPDADEAREAPA